MERKTYEEPEIISAFSTDKSEDYAIQPRKYMKPNFGDDRNIKEEYYKEQEKVIFGCYTKKDTKKQLLELSKDEPSDEKHERGVHNVQIKFRFSETESDDDLSENSKQDDINNQYGRQTIDLNGPMYDPALLNNHGKG